MLKRLLFYLLLLICLPSLFLAHEFWLEPSAYRAQPGDLIDIRLFVGEGFEGQEYGRNERLIKEFFLLDSKNRLKVEGRHGKRPAGFVKIQEPGLQVIGYRTRHSTIKLKGLEFESYLKEEGLEHISKIRKARGQTDKPATEAYYRCCKSLLNLSSDENFDRRLNMALELVPQKNPLDLKPHEKWPLLVLYQGQPLEGCLVRARAKGQKEPIEIRSNAQGLVELSLKSSGVWLVSTVHMIEASKNLKTDWESIWSSLTFEIQSP